MTEREAIGPADAQREESGPAVGPEPASGLEAEADERALLDKVDALLARHRATIRTPEVPLLTEVVELGEAGCAEHRAGAATAEAAQAEPGTGPGPASGPDAAPAPAPAVEARVDGGVADVPRDTDAAADAGGEPGDGSAPDGAGAGDVPACLPAERPIGHDASPADAGAPPRPAPPADPPDPADAAARVVAALGPAVEAALQRALLAALPAVAAQALADARAALLATVEAELGRGTPTAAAVDPAARSSLADETARSTPD